MYDKIIAKMSEVTPVKDENNFYLSGNQWVILIYKFGLVARKYMDINLVLENYLDGSSAELEISEGVSDQDLANFTDIYPTKLVSQYTVYMGRAFKLSFTFNKSRIIATLSKRSGIMSELRELCIQNNWFTCGSNRQYSRLFDMAKNGASIHDLVLIIWLCSEDADKGDIKRQLKELGYK